MLVRGRMAGCKICKLLDIILTRSMNEQEASRGDPVVLVHPKLDSLLHVLVFPDFPFFPSLQLWTRQHRQLDITWVKGQHALILMNCNAHMYYTSVEHWKKTWIWCTTSSSTMTTVLRMFRFRARSHSNWTLSTLFWPTPSSYTKYSSDMDQHCPMLLVPPVWTVKWVWKIE